MDDLIEALQIFRKYKNEKYPTQCEHDMLMVTGISKDEVSADDQKRLAELSFLWRDREDYWYSYRFGSC